MARGWGSFATGLVTGYTSGKKAQQQQELHDLQVAKLKDERALADELKSIDSQAKPSEGFVLTTPDGEHQVFTDEKAAKEAEKAGDGAFKLEKAFIVGGQQYASKEEADQAADTANLPAVKMRMRAEAAMKHGQPVLAGQYGQAYKSLVDANRQITFDKYNEMRQSGDVDGILHMINSRPGSKGQVSIIGTDNGGVALQTVVDGKPYIGQAFGSVNELLDGVGAQISATPDNFFERNLATQRFGLDKDKFAHQQDVDAKQLANAATGLGLQAQGLGLRRQELNDARTARNNPAPEFRFGTNEAGETVPIVQSSTRGADGNWRTSVTPQPAMTGVFPATRKQDPFTGLFAPPKPFMFDGSGVPPRAKPTPQAVPNTGGSAPAGGLRPPPAGAATDFRAPGANEAAIRAFHEEQMRRSLEAQVGH